MVFGFSGDTRTFQYVNTQTPINIMRTLLLTAAAALVLCATDVRAQGGTTATPVQTKPMTTPKPAPTDDLTAQKRSMSGALKSTMATAENLLSSTLKMAEGATGERKDMILKATTSINTLKNDLNLQLGQVNGATEKTAPGIMNKAKEVNATSTRMLEQLKAELPATKPAVTPADTKLVMPEETK